MFVRVLWITPLITMFLSPLILADTAPPVNSAPQSTRLHQSIVTVPMEMWGGRPVVHAKINGQGPFKLLLDTGTTLAAVLDESLVKKLEIPTTREAPALGSAVEDQPVEIDTIAIGDAEFSKVLAIQADFSGFMPAGTETYAGILGLPLFENCLLTLDYPGRRVIFESGGLPEVGGETIPYSPDRERDFGVTISLSVAGVDVKAHVDTGSPGFATFLNKMQEKLPLVGKPRVVGMARTPMGNAQVRTAQLDGNVKIGVHEFTKPRIDFADLGPMVEHDCGNVGYRLLKDFAITLDQKNRRLRLRRGSGAEAPTDQPQQKGSK